MPVHPAADLFPLMSPDELDALGADIKQHGLKSRIALWKDGAFNDPKATTYLLDGRNRLDALERNGVALVTPGGKFDPRALGGAHESDVLVRLYRLRVERMVGNEPVVGDGCNPWIYATSANLHRRHLTTDQRRDLIAKLIKAQPSKSDRQIAEQTKADHKTVGKVRAALEATGEIPQLTKTTGKDGKARKKPAQPISTTTVAPKAKDRAVQAAADRAVARSSSEEAQRQRIQAAASGVNITPMPKPEPDAPDPLIDPPTLSKTAQETDQRERRGAMNDARTNYARAVAGYDDDFRKRLAGAILTAIAETSLVTDAKVMCLRTGETRDALVDCLITIMALTPFYDVPSHLREYAEQLAKKIRRDVARHRAELCPEAERMFGFRNGGRAQ
jgi:hypothetical protein